MQSACGKNCKDKWVPKAYPLPSLLVTVQVTTRPTMYRVRLFSFPKLLTDIGYSDVYVPTVNIVISTSMFNVADYSLRPVMMNNRNVEQVNLHIYRNAMVKGSQWLTWLQMCLLSIVNLQRAWAGRIIFCVYFLLLTRIVAVPNNMQSPRLLRRLWQYNVLEVNCLCSVVKLICIETTRGEHGPTVV